MQIFTNLTKDEPPKEEEVIPVDTMEEYNEIDETNPETQDAFAAYLAEGSQKDREVHLSLYKYIMRILQYVLFIFRWFSAESLA